MMKLKDTLRVRMVVATVWGCRLTSKLFGGKVFMMLAYGNWFLVGVGVCRLVLLRELLSCLDLVLIVRSLSCQFYVID